MLEIEAMVVVMMAVVDSVFVAAAAEEGMAQL